MPLPSPAAGSHRRNHAASCMPRESAAREVGAAGMRLHAGTEEQEKSQCPTFVCMNSHKKRQDTRKISALAYRQQPQVKREKVDEDVSNAALCCAPAHAEDATIEAIEKKSKSMF